MSGTVFIQIFLVADVFVMGMLAVIAYQHARGHLKQKAPVDDTKQTPESFRLSEDAKARLIKASQEKFQEAVSSSSNKLHHDLDATAEHINGLVINLATDIVGDELEKYSKELSSLQKQAQTDMGGIRTEINKHKAEIEAKIEQEVQAEKLRLLKQIDAKLADAVSSFLVEALQDNVDLGSQGPYLVSLLEEHKAELIKEMKDETRTAA